MHTSNAANGHNGLEKPPQTAHVKHSHQEQVLTDGNDDGNRENLVQLNRSRGNDDMSRPVEKPYPNMRLCYSELKRKGAWVSKR